MGDVADEPHRHAGEVAEAFADREDVEEPLGRVLVRAVASVDDADVEVLGKKMGGTRRGVADNDGVNSHRLEVFRRVDERLPLGEAGP